VASGDVQQGEKIKTAGLETRVPSEKSRQDASVPIRGDAMERHHLPTHCVAGIYDLVASGDVQQGEKIKTAGLETRVPLEEEPAGCQRSDKRKCHGTPPSPDALRGRDLRPGGICELRGFTLRALRLGLPQRALRLRRSVRKGINRIPLDFPMNAAWYK
jgi:hypothetical protein